MNVMAWGAGLVLAGLMVQPGWAQDNQSAYTDLKLQECTITKADDFGAIWACPGYRGIPVMVMEGDLRFFVSYGLNSTTEPAAEQTLPPFNTLGPRIEWRLTSRAGAITPFATIVRFLLDAPEGEGPGGQVLVVTRLEEGATCHVAYVDARANSDANELARKAADELAPGFDCASDEPEIVGAFSAY